VSNNASLCLLILHKRCSDHLQVDSSTDFTGAVSKMQCWFSVHWMLLFYISATFVSPYHSSDKLSGLSVSSRRCDLHVHLKISGFNPTLKLSISINFNLCYLKRKCYTPINGSNNHAQYAICLTVKDFVNYVITVVAHTGKSCYYHFKIISIYSVISEAEQGRVTCTRVTLCNTALQQGS